MPRKRLPAQASELFSEWRLADQRRGEQRELLDRLALEDGAGGPSQAFVDARQALDFFERRERLLLIDVGAAMLREARASEQAAGEAVEALRREQLRPRTARRDELERALRQRQGGYHRDRRRLLEPDRDVPELTAELVGLAAELRDVARQHERLQRQVEQARRWRQQVEAAARRGPDAVFVLAREHFA